MTIKADLFFSFRSPFCYFAAAQYLTLTRDYDLRITLRPVFPLAIHAPKIIENQPPLALHYLLRDAARMSSYLKMPFSPPRPDPVPMDLDTRRIAEDQPHIRPITFLGVAATRLERGLEFAFHASSMIWSGVNDWNSNENLGEAASRAGLSLPEMLAMIAGRELELDEEVALNHEALESAGHWNTPALVFRGEPFFGLERIDMALWRMQRRGLKQR